MEGITLENLDNNDTGQFLEEGKKYLEKGDFVLAEKYLKKATKSGNREAFLLLFDIFLKDDRTNIAEKYLKPIADGGDLEFQNKLGEVYSQKANFELAEYYFKLAIGNGNKKAQYNLGKLYYEYQKKDLATENLKIAADQGQDQEAQVLLAKIYKDSGQTDLAQHYLSAAKDNAKAYYYLGNLYEEKNELALAENNWKIAADEYDDKSAQKKLVNYYKDNLTLQKHYLSLLADKNNLEAFVKLGDIFSQEKNYGLAFSNYNNFFNATSNLKDKPKPDMSGIDKEKLKLNYGKSCVSLGKFEIAEECFKDNKYLSDNENIIEVAKLYETAQQFKKAIEYYKLALHIQ
ncbi:tetratricopeptide repeat protein [Leptotrichia sp. oral taxon 847]|uniref:tetratricopeptide repeat protein n=1 Tax=Leptotrichia sp. oral taxon 847 TaxID=1785996 RepID=UPI000768229A|nr:sel1 repeat family protein [Leptotrichia sp. oral taxon 847]AMD94734.1 hypothetical protein AXF11_03465 [Leptotrichia sp. oral taxon 847]